MLHVLLLQVSSADDADTCFAYSPIKVMEALLVVTSMTTALAAAIHQATSSSKDHAAVCRPHSPTNALYLAALVRFMTASTVCSKKRMDQTCGIE